MIPSNSTLNRFLDSLSHLYKRVCPSVCLYVRPSRVSCIRFLFLNDVINRANSLTRITPLPLTQFQIHVMVTSQSCLATSGSSFMAATMKVLRMNVDSIVLLPQSQRDLRTTLSQIYTGEDFSFVKNWYYDIVENGVGESPIERRYFRPYVNLMMNQNCPKHLRFR